MKKLPLHFLALALSATVATAATGETKPLATVSADAAQPRAPADLAWFTEARFGLFIHWGMYSTLGDEYAGKRRDLAEQIQWECKIPNAEYAKLADKFNPVKFDAREYARLAKAAGMKYLVVTGKHHDGFAMFKSPSHPFNIVDATPFRRDAVGELADACRAEGLKFCVYYSLGRDWKEPDVPASKQNDWDFTGKKKPDIGAYIARKVKPQLREILTQYGPIDAIWFDTPERIKPAQSADLLAFVRALQPRCLVNARVGNGLGDYNQTEQTVPAYATRSGKPFEACMTMNKHWGFDKADHAWKSSDDMLRILVDVVSKGGNLLLNIGPDGEGVIPEPSVERLKAMGDWLRVNGESVYGAGKTAFGHEFAGATVQDSGVDAMGQEIRRANPVGNPALGHGVATPHGWRCTTRPGALYIHLLDRTEAKLSLTKVPAIITAATLLDGGAPVVYSQIGDALTLTLPEKLPATPVLVIKLTTAAVSE